MGMNTPHGNLTFPWASFTSFNLLPFSSFSASFHPSRVHSETAEIEESSIPGLQSPRDTPPPDDQQRYPHSSSAHPSQRGIASPHPSHRVPAPVTTRSGPISTPSPRPASPRGVQHASPGLSRPTSPAVQSGRVASPSPPPPQSSRTPYPFLGTQHFAVSRTGSVTTLPFTTLENTLAGPFTRRFSRPVRLPIAELEQKYPGEGNPLNPYLVDFSSDDPANPLNWNKRFKWILTSHLTLVCLCSVFTSSSYVGGIESMQVHFRGLSNELAVAGLSTYLLGQAFGSLLWAPLSEIIGRRQAFLFSWPLFVLFNLVCAVAKSVSAIIVARFVAGLFCSAQLSNQAGQVKDMWTTEESIMPGGLTLLAPVLGPVLGPVISGFVGENSGFRAIFYISFAWGLFHLITWTLFVPETHPPTLIRRKAAKLQKQADQVVTGEHFISRYDKNKKPAIEILKTGLARPFEMLFREAILWTLSLYMGLVYGTLFLLFTAYPIVFQELREWTLGLSGLALLGIGIGMIIGFWIGIALLAKNYARARRTTPIHLPVPPETQMRVMTVGAIILPIGLFGFAWTATPSVHWIVCIIFSVIFGLGYTILFASGLTFLLDAYNVLAVSAVMANGILRFLFGAAFPLFALYLLEHLGVHWAVTLLAFPTLAFAPVPLLFYRYGRFLRRKSKYIPTDSLLRTAQGPAPTSTLAQTFTSKSPISPYSEKARTRDPSPPARNLIAQGQDRTSVPGNRSKPGYDGFAGRDENARRPSSTAPTDSRSGLGHEPATANRSRSSFVVEGRVHSPTPGSRSRSGYAQVDGDDDDEGDVGITSRGYDEDVFQPLVVDEEADWGIRETLRERGRDEEREAWRRVDAGL